MQELKLNTIYLGDAKEVLSAFPDKTVDCCVTSPPYYGLRDYDIKEQLGREESPEEYIENLVSVFREIYRVLKDEGTLWVNIGDSYCHNVQTHNSNSSLQRNNRGAMSHFSKRDFSKSGIKRKDLIGIPWTLAFALRADGWFLRQDIIWHKSNPMPESVTDRCTRSHEYIFMLSKKPKYYYDIDAIREPHTSLADLERRVRNGKSEWKTVKACAGSPYAIGGTGRDRRQNYHPLGRNKRDVWQVSLTNTKEAHFATYPEKLIVDCIKAGCPVGGVVLDPFIGSGTTAVVAMKNDRNYVGIELNPEYIDIAESRISKFK